MLSSNCFTASRTGKFVSMIQGKGTTASRMLVLGCVAILTACQPLYSSGGLSPASTSYGNLPGNSIAVTPVHDRVGQQVSNHLAFLLQGGETPVEPRYRVDLRTRAISQLLASTRRGKFASAGKVTVTANYTIIDTQNKSATVSLGKRVAQAAYDRTGQNFANDRAKRDAENRAAKEVAESLRLAILTDIKNANTAGN